MTAETVPETLLDTDTIWIRGVKPEWNAACVRVYRGRLYMGLRGYDIKSRAHGFIRVELEPTAIVELSRLLRAHVYGEALEEIA